MDVRRCRSILYYIHYVVGQLKPPRAGGLAGVNYKGEEQHWQKVELDDSGIITNDQLRGGYLYLSHMAEKDETLIVQPNGFSEIIVNGVLRAGDGYGKEWVLLPVKFKQGLNEIWCRASRGKSKSVVLSAPPNPVYLTTIDATVPDFLTTESQEKWAAIRIVNATESTLMGLEIRAEMNGEALTTPFSSTVTPMTVRKIPFKIMGTSDELGEQAVIVSLFQNGRLIDEVDLTIEVKEPSKNYRRTFVSEIDGSVQYYGVRQGKAETGRKPALFLSVHGAGVKAIGQAGSYKSKDWGHVIAPTNRREFGFDWEDWGRLDAMEVLADAEAIYNTDPTRTYLTGHSMGGHGSWHLGATYPSRWAAIAPIAGWRSFFSYARSPSSEEPHPMRAMMDRAANPSRTLNLIRNYTHEGVYIEHGESDRNVPVSEARFMVEQLASFHPDFAYLEEPGAGHWYGVDHQNVFDYFKWHTVKDVRDMEVLNFRIACPGISADSFYVTLYQQESPFDFCGIVSKQTIRSRRQRRQGGDISERKFAITTENLHCFKVDLSHCKELKQVGMEVDGQAIDNLPWPQKEHIWLKKQDEEWNVIERPNNPEQKNPQRYGGFKDAFRHNMLFVYSTQGTKEENAWSYNKARFDAETFYYRGNGSIDIISDSQFTLNKYVDRSVILYGNSSTNAAWDLLLGDCPVQVNRGEIKVGSRILTGDDLGTLMIRPRKDSDIASVGVVAGTGMPGFRSVNPNRYFLAGTGYPDLMILTPEIYSEGLDGVKVAGYFGNDWGLNSGEFVWSDE